MSLPAGTTSFDLPINADQYTVRAFMGGGEFVDTTCDGNPLAGGTPTPVDPPAAPGAPVPPGEFVCAVTDDVLTWTDIGANNYALRRVVNGTDTFFTSVPAGTTSFDLNVNSDGYIVRAVFGPGNFMDTECDGNPANAGGVVPIANFACSVSGDVLSWTNVGANSYAIRPIVNGTSTFFDSVPGGTTSFDLAINREAYTVRAFIGGGQPAVDTTCAGNP